MANNPTLHAEAFWRFSLDVYGREGVQDALLALQDRHGADVNLVLLAFWLGLQRQCVDEHQAATLRALSSDWQTKIVGPLRAVRNELKVPTHDRLRHVDARGARLRRRVLEVELDAERLEQELLLRAIGAFESTEAIPEKAGWANLRRLVPEAMGAPELIRRLGATLWPSAQSTPEASAYSTSKGNIDD